MRRSGEISPRSTSVLIVGGGVAGRVAAMALKHAGFNVTVYDARAATASMIRGGIRIEHGKRLVDARESPDGGVVACFDDGSAALGDCLIGADGVHSCVRRIIMSATSQPRRIDQRSPAGLRWSRGPMVVIGAAARGLSQSAGKGASLAIEDAIALASCLQDIPDVALAFAAFEALRRLPAAEPSLYGLRAHQPKSAVMTIARMFRDLIMPWRAALSYGYSNRPRS
jgi:2-polyprenyl-6-methoxyphenol hydroxylase-like FAD-dependent oxidoreductase